MANTVISHIATAQSHFRTGSKSGAESESGIRVAPLSIDAASQQLKKLQRATSNITLTSSRSEGAGPGAEAFDQLLDEVVQMRDALTAMIARTEQALLNAKDDFTATDEDEAANLGALGNGKLLR